MGGQDLAVCVNHKRSFGYGDSSELHSGLHGQERADWFGTQYGIDMNAQQVFSTHPLQQVAVAQLY